MKLPKSGLLQFSFNKFNSKKYKDNLVVKKTREYLSSNIINIKYVRSMHKYNTRKKVEYSAIAWCVSDHLIVINERVNFTLDKFLETVIHEVNHVLNLSCKNDKYCLMKLEMMAYIAEYMFHNNMYILTRNKFKEIKDKCFSDYRKFKGYEKYTKQQIYNGMDITKTLLDCVCI